MKLFLTTALLFTALSGAAMAYPHHHRHQVCHWHHHHQVCHWEH